MFHVIIAVTKMSKNSQHVAPSTGGWSVRRAGALRASGVFKTQDEAIKRGREIAKNQKSELFIHGRDGRIREKSSFGNDPFPSKG
jgi:Uncharacterized protein conserved in bacteria (DUF2188)